jgi:hypothetical protein
MMSGPMKLAFVLLASISLAACASGSGPGGQGAAANLSASIADMPYWMGGLPPGVPPRPGTPEYDAWQAEWAQEADRPKTTPVAEAMIVAVPAQ